MENKERAVEALEKIEKVIDEIRDMFPDIKKEQIKIFVKNKKYNDPVKILKKVDRIIINYNESNAERKLESLLGFLGITVKKEK
ncbi:MAG: hypothetical protein KAI71_02365 [Candidatus Pacebacteria bacterium]|nr:hypothetical protein [Candidatus Paceibacterota bacterium]